MKICLIHASAGAGHKRAAEALFLGIKKYTPHEVVCIDALDYTPNFFKNLYRNSYTFLVSKTPVVWKFFFWLLDIPWLQKYFRSLRRIYNGIYAKKLEEYFIQEKFDYVISTHFLPNEVVSSLKHSNLINSRLISCVTDFDVHRIWLADHVDIYCVASEWTKEKLKWLGVNLERIVPTGIPTLEDFSAAPDIGQLKDSLGIKKDTFTVLIATGSFGFGPIETLIKRLAGFQIIVITGYNKKLYDRLSSENYPDIKVLGHVNNMHELMAVSDVMITKPGGLSISEALVSQLPMIFFAPIPGQETNNIKVLNSFGIGTKSYKIESVVQECHRLRNSNDAYHTALKKTKNLASPDAVKRVISLLS